MTDETPKDTRTTLERLRAGELPLEPHPLGPYAIDLPRSGARGEMMTIVDITAITVISQIGSTSMLFLSGDSTGFELGMSRDAVVKVLVAAYHAAESRHAAS